MLIILPFTTDGIIYGDIVKVDEKEYEIIKGTTGLDHKSRNKTVLILKEKLSETQS